MKYLLALLPLSILCVFMALTSSNVPQGDQWDYITMFQKIYADGVSLPLLLARQSEHLMFFPRLITVPVALLTGWNLRYEALANLLTGICVFILLLRLTEATPGFSGRGAKNLAYLFMSVLVFSVSQSENWFFGVTAPWLVAFCLISGIMLLCSAKPGRKHLLLAYLLGIIATCSFGNGLVYWPVLFGVICARKLENKKTFVYSWMLLSAATVALYFSGYHAPAPQYPPPKSVFQVLSYIFVFLGSPFIPFARFAPLAGTLGLACFCMLCLMGYTLHRRARNDQKTLLSSLPWFSLALYSFISALICAAFRSGCGPEQATASRYVTMSIYIPIAVFMLAPAYLKFTETGVFKNKKLVYCCLILFFALQAAVTKQRWAYENRRRKELAEMETELLSGRVDEERIKKVLIAYGNIPEKIAFLKNRRLTVFGEKRPGPAD